jgi:hypothetical protein
MTSRVFDVVSRSVGYAILACALAALAIHAAGWIAAAGAVWQHGSLYVPGIQSLLVLGLGLLTIRVSASGGRRTRRLVVATALAGTLAAFLLAPLPLRFEGNGYVADGADNIGDRAKFERRFPIATGPTMGFHSHLGDLLMARLDRAFSETGDSTARAYATLSRLGGLLFLVELFVVTTWHKCSRRICRFVGLVIASPLSLLYFGYYELGYLAMSVGVIPLLAVRRRPFVQVTASTLLAGLLQGVHTALHGFGLLGLAGGALALLTERGAAVRNAVRTVTFASAGVAMYVGWVFVYVVGMKVSIVVDNAVSGMSLRHLFEAAIYDKRIAYPVFSSLGLAEIGLIGMVAGVPLLVLAAFRSPRAGVVTAAAYALPGLWFLIAWWPPGAPINLDLLMAAFPGRFAACWLLASSHRRTVPGFVLLVMLHTLFWTNIGSTIITRIWVEPAA